MRGTLFGGPYKKDPTIWGALLGSPSFGNSQVVRTQTPTLSTHYLLKGDPCGSRRVPTRSSWTCLGTLSGVGVKV